MELLANDEEYPARSDKSVSGSADSIADESVADHGTLPVKQVNGERFGRSEGEADENPTASRSKEAGLPSVEDAHGQTIAASVTLERNTRGELQPSQIDPALEQARPPAMPAMEAIPSRPGLSFAPLEVQRRQFQQFRLQPSPQPFFSAQPYPFASSPFQFFPHPAPYPYTIPPLSPDADPGDPFVGMILTDIEHIHKLFTEYAKRVGFAITKSKSSSERTYQLVCKCHGTPRNTRHLPTIKGEELDGKIRRRDLHSRKTGCEWRAKFKMQFNDQWVLTYLGEHNHEMEPDMATRYAENRQTTEQGIELMKALKKTSATYKEIADVVNATTGSNLLARDVYNRTKDVPRARPMKRGRPSSK
ncbi:hypothetical protein V1515DRAFT_605367 [Lipomyces mesembrius]